MRYLLIGILLLYQNFGFAQRVYSTKHDISEAQEIVFFGYDFGHFKLFEPKRLMEDGIKKNIPLWIDYLSAKEDEDFLKKKMRKNKIIFDFKYLTDIYHSLPESGLVSLSKCTIPVDSIQSIINNYQTSQKEGIGLTIIVECFNKKIDASSAYFTFFDISTKKILMTDHYSTSNHASGLGLSTYWGRAFEATVYAYFDEEYKKNLKKNNCCI